MKKLIIIGVGGFGREVAWLVERINNVVPEWDLIGFIDDNKDFHGTDVNGYQVLGDSEWLRNQSEDIFAVCAVGSSKVRKKIINKLGNQKYATLIDPSVQLSNLVEIGEGSIICAGTIITVNVTLGSHVIINLDCTIGHNAVINSFTTLYPSVNISGDTILAECVEMGTGSQIIQGLKIERATVVGAGSTVVKNLPEYCVAVGSPAKNIKSLQRE